MVGSRLHKREQESGKLCSYDEERGIMIHRFEAAAIQCRCGEVLVRKPVKKQRMGKFGKQATGEYTED